MKLAVMSDTHLSHQWLTVPDADVVIHCGDSLGHGNLSELMGFADWYAALPHKHKILIAGNHDWVFQEAPEIARQVCEQRGIHYLCDQAITIDGWKFYGSPWTPQFCNWAYMLPRGQALAQKWAHIHDDTDVLITHGPPYGHGDKAPPNRVVGCRELLERVCQVAPKLHLFGHIHEGFGFTRSDDVNTLFVNAAMTGGVRRPHLIDLVHAAE